MQDCVSAARALLENLTPLVSDCGLLCRQACCRPDEDGQGGVALFPGEAALYAGSDWARVEGGILYCGGDCPRSERPLGCRIFPLTPYRQKSGATGVRIDRRAFSMCPLAPHGVRALDPRFTAAALRALSLIDQAPEGRAFLKDWMGAERRFRSAGLY
jgi:hypothetical protein